MAINVRDFFNQEKRKEMLVGAIRVAKSKISEEISPGVTTQNTKKEELGILGLLCDNLTQKVRDGKGNLVVGRDSEVNSLIEILERKNKNNALLVGDSGVGKTAIIEAFAQRIVSGEVPASLRDVEILSLDPMKLIAGKKLNSDIENRLSKVLAKAAELNSKYILFIDDIQNIATENAGESVLLLLKNSLVRSISTTSSDIYRKSFEKDPSFLRRFHVLMIEPASAENTIEILTGIAKKYEESYGVSISKDAILAAVNLSNRYVGGRHLPDKAVDLLEQAATSLMIEREKDELVSETLNKNHIAEIITKWTGIPVSKMMESEKEKLKSMELILNGKVIGQSKPVASISNSIRRSRMGISDPKKPIGSFLLLGPTGVGKTELAKAVAEFMFDSADSMHRFDMSEFGEKHNVAKMLGAPVGYAGHDQGGLLTDPIRQNPYTVVLFDEIEKAHPDVWNIWLQILDEGRLTDQQGRLVDFRNTIIIMTSNIGARATLEDLPEETIKDRVMDEVKKAFKPELLNRIDDVVVFSKLNKAGIRRIVDLQLKNFVKRFEDKEIYFDIKDSAKDFLADKGYDPAYGARPLKRAIQKYLEDQVANDLMNSKFGVGDTICVDCIENGLQFSKAA